MTASESNIVAKPRPSVDELRARLGAIPVEADADAVADLSIDTYWKAKALAAAGRPFLAEAVVEAADGARDRRRARRRNGARALRDASGGGSGSQGGAVPHRGGIVLDTSALDEIIELDEVSQTVRVQAGVLGLELERWLNERGYTFPHFPASVHSSPGRWISRSQGVWDPVNEVAR